MAIRFQRRKLARLRKEQGLSYRDAAGLCGVDHSALVLWESGKRVPTMESLDKLAKGFGVEFLFFLRS